MGAQCSSALILDKWLEFPLQFHVPVSQQKVSNTKEGDWRIKPYFFLF